MNTDTGLLGYYAELQQSATDPTDVAPIPKELQAEALKLQAQGKVVDLQGDSPLAQFARDHQRRKKKKKTQARTRRKEAKRLKAHQRRRT